MNELAGGCDCGNVTFTIVSALDTRSINPRACDCDFCVKHGAAYISDANGQLKVHVKDKANLSEYHQGSGIATFLVCKQCGVLIGGCYESDNQRYAAINSRSVSREVHFGLDVLSSPKVLTDDEKTQRWRDLWFSHVEIEYESDSLE
jgi:hypothetical protein